MPDVAETREYETRKLEALSAISAALATLGASIVSLARQSSEHGQLLRSVDRKIDVLARIVAGEDATGKLPRER